MFFQHCAPILDPNAAYSRPDQAAILQRLGHGAPERGKRGRQSRAQGKWVPIDHPERIELGQRASRVPQLDPRDAQRRKRGPDARSIAINFGILIDRYLPQSGAGDLCCVAGVVDDAAGSQDMQIHLCRAE